MFPSFWLFSRFSCLSSLPCAGKAAAAAPNNRKIPAKIRKTYVVSTRPRKKFKNFSKKTCNFYRFMVT
jgi:ribosomal protein S30